MRQNSSPKGFVQFQIQKNFNMVDSAIFLASLKAFFEMLNALSATLEVANIKPCLHHFTESFSGKQKSAICLSFIELKTDDMMDMLDGWMAGSMCISPKF